MALPPDYMSPEMYMGFYRHMVVTLPDRSVVQVDIRKYLNHGKVIPMPAAGEAPKKGGIMEERATAANKEYWQLMGRVATDPFRDSPEGNAKKITAFQLPLSFKIQGEVFARPGIHRAFMGKGSSYEVYRAVCLASRYDRKISTETYCDKYLGLDCTGFVSNYWGMSKAELVDHKYFDKNRRKDLTAITIGDAMVYYSGPPSKEHKTVRSVHIAVVNEVESVVQSGADWMITMNVVESAGEDEGLHKTATRAIKFKKNSDGELYYETDKGRTGYICGGPPRNRPNGF